VPPAPKAVAGANPAPATSKEGEEKAGEQDMLAQFLLDDV
jgi:hypothetical protein